MFDTDPTTPTLQAMMRHLSEVHSDWFVFGIALGVPISKLRARHRNFSLARRSGEVDG